MFLVWFELEDIDTLLLGFPAARAVVDIMDMRKFVFYFLHFVFQYFSVCFIFIVWIQAQVATPDLKSVILLTGFLIQHHALLKWKSTSKNVFGEERDYSRANMLLLFITLSTMQRDKMEKLSVTQWRLDNSFQFGKYCDMSFVATKEQFHITTVCLYVCYFTSELLSAESSSSLLVFPVRWEEREREKSPFIHYTAVKNAPELSNT